MSNEDKKSQDPNKKFHIIINARPHEVSGPTISYIQVVQLAFPNSVSEISDGKIPSIKIERSMSQSEIGGVRFNEKAINLERHFC